MITDYGSYASYILALLSLGMFLTKKTQLAFYLLILATYVLLVSV